jgi:hypothetical protein
MLGIAISWLVVKEEWLAIKINTQSDSCSLCIRTGPDFVLELSLYIMNSIHVVPFDSAWNVSY